MSIQGNLKTMVKKILTDRCGRDYEHTYCHALKCSGYTNTIAAAEEKRLWQWRDEVAEGVGKEAGTEKSGEMLPGVVAYDWEQSIDLSHILETTEEELLVFLDNSAKLSEHALEAVKLWATKHPEQSCFYGDEDVVGVEDAQGAPESALKTGTANCRIHPWLKPDWSPQLFESMFYVGGVFAARRELLLAAQDAWQDLKCEATVAQLIGLLLFVAGGLEKRPEQVSLCPADAAEISQSPTWGETIGHIPYVLCHHKSEADYDRYMRAWDEKENLFRFVKMDRMRHITSVIIPSKDQPEVLERNIKSLVRTTLGLPLEILVVDNGSREENRQRIEKMLGELSWHQVQYIYEPMDFNFSKMCNVGAERATGDVLLFLNDDTEATEEGWIEKLQGLALNPQVGAVGAKLLYPASDKIQHAGIVNIPMGPVHKLQFKSDGENYYFRRNKTTANVLAVTGACLMVTAEKFREAGGFSEELPVAFNDVDLCFSLYEKGYYNVVCNEAALYHYESLSRGDDESAEKLARLDRERTKLYERHPKLQGRDPYYHEYLNHEGLDTRIVPAPEEWLRGGAERVQVRKITLPSISEDANSGRIRLHKGLHLRLESVGGNFCQGYSFMTGDDNACYQKELLLEEETNGCCFTATLKPQLRMDLQENMPDQKNVAMCGFSLYVQDLPAGVYRVGVLAKNKVTGVTYLNSSERRLHISR